MSDTPRTDDYKGKHPRLLALAECIVIVIIYACVAFLASWLGITLARAVHYSTNP